MHIFGILIKFSIQRPEKTLQNLVQSSRKAVPKFELPETQFEKTVRGKIAGKKTWSKKMTVLCTFLESLLNFLSNDLKKHYKIWYSQVEKRCQSLNCQKHNLKGQSGTKSFVKLTCSEKMTVLSTFFKSSLNFLYNNLKKHYKICYNQGEKRCQNLNCQKHNLKG